jgi:hypothetical protein
MPERPKQIRLRFAAVDNFDEARTFFEKPLLTDSEALERVERVAMVEKGTWIVEVESRGAVAILTRKLPQEESGGIHDRSGG